MTQVLHLSSGWNKFSRLLVDINPIYCFPLVAEFSPQDFEMFSISPHQAYPFVVGFPTTPLYPSQKGAFQAHLWQKLAFSSPFGYSNDLSSILSSGGIVMLLFSLIISNWEDHVLFVLIHLTGVVHPLFKFFSSYQVLHLFSTGVLSEFDLPCSLFILFQPEWFQFLLVHCTCHS